MQLEKTFDAVGKIVSVTKRFEISAGHQLVNHKGRCSRRHGHNFIIEVTVRGSVRPVDGDSDEGMVVDFGDIKDVFKRRIESVMDHYDLNEALPVKVTSSENMVVWIYDEMKKELPGMYSVRIYETSNSWAEYIN